MNTPTTDNNTPTAWQRPEMAERFAHVRQDIPFLPTMIDLALQLIDGIGRPVRHIVDLGCGAGDLAAVLADRYADATMTLVDFSPPMLAAARQRFAETPRVTVIDADLQTTPLASFIDQPADVVISSLALHHLSRQRQRSIYAEGFERLAPGGILVQIEHTGSAAPRYETMFYDAMIEAAVEAGQRRGQPVDRQVIVDRIEAGRPLNIHVPVEQQLTWLREIGFVDVDCAFRWLELSVFAGYRPHAG